ncbi:CCA tRNA nucleotidyltransferase [Pelagibacterales bacterium SAG-MED15]|nr:CCA tRNA nucleotidyltransferase [Pelagibacterales bacterium SAG-MED15]
MFNFLNKFFASSNNIKSKFFDLQKNSSVKKIFEAFQDYSTDSEIRYVGGCVRKILNNEKVDDIDMATNLNPEEIKQVLKKKNIKFYETGKDHGTITAHINDEKYEITPLRSDVTTDGRHAKVQFTKDWRKDAERRDFTINSIYSDINGNLFDPFEGKKDLENGKVIFVGDEDKRIKEDYLRILRYLRFFSNYSRTEHNFITLRNIKKNLNGVSKVSSERMLDEFKKIYISQSLYQLSLNRDSFELLQLIFPQFKNLEKIKKLNPLAKEKLKDIDFIFLLGLLTIDETDNLDYFLFKYNISKKDQKRLINIKSFFYSKKDTFKINFQSLWKYYYLYGQQSLNDILNFKIFISKKNDKKFIDLIHYFKNKKAPVFPIKAEDLMKKFNFTEGKKLGENLKILEDYWINNNFKINEKDIKKIVKY